jgi:hypothetical protein
MSDNCMICNEPTPPGHVNVRDRKGTIVGRVCSKHPLKDVILDPMERFDVEVIFEPFGAGTGSGDL